MRKGGFLPLSPRRLLTSTPTQYTVLLKHLINSAAARRQLTALSIVIELI